LKKKKEDFGDLSIEGKLTKFTSNLLKTQGVLNLEAIKKAANIANTGVAIPEDAIKISLNKIATAITPDLYMLKSTGNSELDACRNIIAALFRLKNKYRKTEVVDEIKQKLKGKDIPMATFPKIMNEFAFKPVTGGLWTLKSGELQTSSSPAEAITTTAAAATTSTTTTTTTNTS